MRVLFVLLIIAGNMTLSGCGLAIGSHRLLPPSSLFPPIKIQPYNSSTDEPMPSPKPINVFPSDQPHPQGCVPIAIVTANGNSFASEQDLMSTLAKEGAKIGADFVVMQRPGTTQSMTVGTYGGGLAMAQPIYTPFTHGIACKPAKVILGLNFEENWTIQYVRPGQLGERLGFHEGDRWLSLNGHYLMDDRFALYREVSMQDPGTKVLIEYIPRGGDKVRREFELR